MVHITLMGEFWGKNKVRHDNYMLQFHCVKPFNLHEGKRMVKFTKR